MTPPPAAAKNRLWLVRHAAPLVAPGTCYGALDVPADAQAPVLRQSDWQRHCHPERAWRIPRYKDVSCWRMIYRHSDPI